MGVSGKTTGLFHSWNPKKHIPQLILELNIHFFNRVEVDFPSDSCNAETQMHQSIMDSLDIKS